MGTAVGAVGFEGLAEAAGVVVEAGAVFFGVGLDAGVACDCAYLGVDQSGFYARGAEGAIEAAGHDLDQDVFGVGGGVEVAAECG